MINIVLYNRRKADQYCDLPSQRIRNSDEFGVEEVKPTPINLTIYPELLINGYEAYLVAFL